MRLTEMPGCLCVFTTKLDADLGPLLRGRGTDRVRRSVLSGCDTEGVAGATSAHSPRPTSGTPGSRRS